MTRHLEEHEITDAVAGIDLDRAVAEHLASCLACRQRLSAFLEAVDARREGLLAEAPDWERQRQEIMSRLPPAQTERSGRRHRWKRPALAVAAVLVAAAGLRVLWRPAPTVELGTTSDLPVEQILAEVDAVLADDSIPGFELIDPDLEAAVSENGSS